MGQAVVRLHLQQSHALSISELRVVHMELNGALKAKIINIESFKSPVIISVEPESVLFSFEAAVHPQPTSGAHVHIVCDSEQRQLTHATIQ